MTQTQPTFILTRSAAPLTHPFPQLRVALVHAAERVGLVHLTHDHVGAGEHVGRGFSWRPPRPDTFAGRSCWRRRARRDSRLIRWAGRRRARPAGPCALHSTHPGDHVLVYRRAVAAFGDCMPGDHVLVHRRAFGDCLAITRTCAPASCSSLW